MNINIENETDTVFDIVSPEEVIKRAILCVADDKGILGTLDVNVLIVTPEDIKTINAEYRGIDQVTDVLSFPYFDFEKPGRLPENALRNLNSAQMDEADNTILGDMVICADKIISQAIEYGHSQERELAYLTVHSMLHILGYDHIEDQDRILMRAEEERIMNILNINR